MIRVLLADDQALIRSGIRALLDAEDDIEVVAEAADGREAVALAEQHRPDIALVDIQMPVLDGLEATRQIVADERLDKVRVVILTNFGLDEYIFRALRAGASGFLLKDTLPADLITAIRVVAAGEALLAPSITRRLISEFARIPPLGTPGPVASGLPTAGRNQGQATGETPLTGGFGGRGLGGPAVAGGPGRGVQVTSLLTDRECEVLRLVAAGLSNAEIASQLRISPATAKTHVAHLLTKLDARDRVQLVIIAFQAGLTNC